MTILEIKFEVGFGELLMRLSHLLQVQERLKNKGLSCIINIITTKVDNYTFGSLAEADIWHQVFDLSVFDDVRFNMQIPPALKKMETNSCATIYSDEEFNFNGDDFDLVLIGELISNKKKPTFLVNFPKEVFDLSNSYQLPDKFNVVHLRLTDYDIMRNILNKEDFLIKSIIRRLFLFIKENSDPIVILSNSNEVGSYLKEEFIKDAILLPKTYPDIVQYGFTHYFNMYRFGTVNNAKDAMLTHIKEILSEMVVLSRANLILTEQCQVSSFFFYPIAHQIMNRNKHIKEILWEE